jgi:predicted kinase
MTPPPICLILTGRPGAGKTTLAALLAGRLRLPLLARDALKEGYVQTHGRPHAELPGDTNAVVTAAFFDLAERTLGHGISVILEAAFQHGLWATHLPRLAAVARPVVVVCAVDGETAARRHLARGLTDAGRVFYHGDDRVATYRASGELRPPEAYAAPALGVPTLTVATADGYAPGLDEIVRWLGEQDLRVVES